MQYTNDPRPMKAKFQSTCKTCGKTIKRDESIIYWPSNKQAFHSECAEKDYGEFLLAKQDEEFFTNSNTSTF